MIPNEVVDKIKKLLKLSTSNNQHEAALAAARATELMLKYQIDAAEVSAEEEPQPDEPVKSMIFDEAKPGTQRRALWKGTLASGLCKAFGCKIWWSSRNHIMFVGRPSDLTAVQYLYQYLVSEINRLTEKGWAEEGEFSGIQGKTWKNSFRVGAAHEITNRVQEQRKVTFKAAEVENKSTALMVIQTREQAVVKFYDKLSSDMHFVSGGGPTVNSRDGYAAGQAAGRKVDIGGHTQLGAAKKLLR